MNLWREGLKHEIAFRENWFRTHGAEYGEASYRATFERRKMQEHVAALIPPEIREPYVLDVGAGPCSQLRADMPDGRRAQIRAIDPLATEYAQMLFKAGEYAHVRTEYGQAETLVQQFGENRFDLVYARNSLDHGWNPVLSIEQIIEVLKPGRYAVLEHLIEVGKRMAYTGLHQWDFSASRGDFVISGMGDSVNITDLLRGRAEVSCEPLPDEWLRVILRKCLN